MKIDNIPSLRIAITNQCNLRCPYCPPDGDNFKISNPKQLNKEEFMHIISIAHQLNIRHFSITGGEPLTRPATTFYLAKEIQKLKNIMYVRLNTNGTLISKFIPEIINSNFSLIKISLDSLVDDNTKPIISSIRKLQEYKIPIRINTVVQKNNVSQIDNFIDFTQKNGIELKLFDITYYKDTISSNPNFWKDNFVSLKPLIKKLTKQFGKPNYVQSIGGYGNPMPVFNSGSITPIRVRTSEHVAFYSYICDQCSDYMCQDGLCNITLTCDGQLKPCRPQGPKLNLSLLDINNNLLPDYEIKQKLEEIIHIFDKSKKIERRIK